MIKIPTPTSSFASHKVSLAGQTYELIFRFNSVSQVWYLDIYLNQTPISLGQALVPTFPLFYGKPINNFDHGVLVVLRNVDTKTPLGRDNLGITKDYGLYYMSNAEWNEILNG